MKKLAIISLFFGLVSNGYSQQDAMFTYYMFNHQSVNPAYVGSKQIINATMLNRSQWTGFAGAPLSHTISLNAPLLNESLGKVSLPKTSCSCWFSRSVIISLKANGLALLKTIFSVFCAFKLKKNKKKRIIEKRTILQLFIRS